MEDRDKSENFIKKSIEKTRKGILGFFVVRYRLIILLAISILALGTISLFSLPRESDPEVKIPIAVVSTFYPGASPVDIEDLITDEIESKLEELSNVKLITSSSITGLSSVVVEFEAEADLDNSIRELKDKVSEIRNLPNEAEDPVVTQVRANDFPIITFSLAGNLTEDQLKQLGDIVQDELESISGVSKAPLFGVRSKEFSVIVNSGSLQRFNLSLSQIVGAISAANIDTPLGSITLEGVDYNLRTVSKIFSVDELKKLPVLNSNGTKILLEDIAIVSEQFADRSSISRISLEGRESISSISIQIFKRTGGNILDIVDGAKEKMEDLKKEGVIPANVYVDISNDFSQFIREDLNILGRSGVQSTIFIFLLMIIALSYKEAIISLFAIPLTFLITFIFLNFFGYTLNSLTLFSLVLSLGLLVDTFIVILEGIFHNMRTGRTSEESALLALAHYKKPLTSGVLTTISAFIPMLLVSGILGEYLKVLPITLSITLFSSLFVSFFIVPSFSALLLKKSKFIEEKKDSILERYLTNRLKKLYKEHICKLLKSKKKKWALTIVAGFFFFSSLGILVTGVIPVELFPEVDVDFAYINIELPVGTDLEATEKVVARVEEKIYNNPYIESFVTTVGQAYSFDFISSSGGENLASVNLNFRPEEKRDKKSYEIVEEIRGELKGIKEGKITVSELGSGPPTGSPVEARISGDDLDVIAELTDKVVGILENTEGVINVESSIDVSPADLVFRLDKEALLKYGLTVPQVSGFLRVAVFGATATEISANGQDFDVIVKLDKNKISGVEDINNLLITGALGNSVHLSQIADFELDPSLAAIMHRDLKRTTTVRADLRPGFTPAVIVPELEKKITEEGLPNGYSVEFGGEVEDIEQSFSELWSAMIVAVLLILTILLIQFDSFIKPFVILIVLPLTLIGVVMGMMLLNLSFSFSVFLGLVSLSGIVVNDAIVLLDKTSRNISEKRMKPRDAVADAGETRLQPIMLTSITTIIGVIPLAIANEFWLGLSIAIIFGLSFATILQLFFVPMFYLKFSGRADLEKMKKSE